MIMEEESSGDRVQHAETVVHRESEVEKEWKTTERNVGQGHLA